MEKNKDKKDKKKKGQKDADERSQALDFEIYISGLPGSDLGFVVKKLSHSVLHQLTDSDYGTIKHIENYFYKRHNRNYLPINGSGTNSTYNGTDISLALPSDILYLFGSYLEPSDCIKLIHVNKKLSQVYNDVKLWRSLCIKRGIDPMLNSLTTSDYKRIFFSETWSFKYEQIEKFIDNKKETTQSSFWKFSVVDFNNIRRNIAYFHLASVLVFNMAEFDTILTEPDGTETTYLDMYKTFVRDWSTRPHGPITKKQYKQATARKNGLGRAGDFHQPVHQLWIVIFFINEAKLKERVRNESIPLVAANNNFTDFFRDQLFANVVAGSSPTIYSFTEDSIVFSALFHVVKDALITRMLTRAGF